MSDDRDIRQTVQIGEQNQAVKELIHNWCSYARVEKHGGIGLIEAQTGLPIGHHAMACDHAPHGGMYTWHLADAALDFHDQNCATCKVRNAVRLPNLSKLVGERDRRREAHQKSADEAQQSAEAAQERRRATRDALRAKLPVTSRTIIDQMEELDKQGDDKLRDTLIGTVRLAPEIVVPELVEYCFQLVEAQEPWFLDVGLTILKDLKAYPKRLVRGAMKSLSRHRAIDVSFSIVVAHPGEIDPSQILAAFSSLAVWASPPYIPFSGAEVAPKPDALLCVSKAHASATRSAIKQFLDSRNPDSIREAAAAIGVIHSQDPGIALHFLRDVLALLVRSEHLIHFTNHQSRSEEAELFGDLREIVALALLSNPDETDALVQSFLGPAKEESGREVVKAYEDIFRQRHRQPEAPEVPGHTLALKRLINTACTSNDTDTLFTIMDLGRGPMPEGLGPLFRREMSFLLGSSALMQQRIEKFEADMKVAKDFLESGDLDNKISAIRQTQEGLIRWIAEVAAADPEARTEYLQLLKGVPEDALTLRAALIKSMSRMMTSVEGMNAVLPHLYTAIVGNSTLLRRASLTSLKSLDSVRSADLPRLVHEAVVASLGDPYVIVHKAAAELLSTFEVMAEFDTEVSNRLLMLIAAYAKKPDDTEFAIDILYRYTKKYSSDQDIADFMGPLTLGVLPKMNQNDLAQRMGWIDKRVRDLPGFAKVLLNLYRSVSRDRLEESAWGWLKELSPTHLASIADDLAAEACKRADSRDEVGSAIEVFTHAGQWASAVRVAVAAVEAIPLQSASTSDACTRDKPSCPSSTRQPLRLAIIQATSRSNGAH